MCAPLIFGESVVPVAFTESRHAIYAFSPFGEITLPVVRVQLEINYPRGKHEFGNLAIVYDPATGHYFWRYARVSHAGETVSFLDAMQEGSEAVYAGPAALVDFAMPAALYEKEHSEHADSLEAAERASMEEIRRGLAEFEGSGYHNDAKAITIPPGIPGTEGREFYCPPDSQRCNGYSRIVSISRQGDNWRLVLRNHFDLEVILDSKFGPVSSRRLTDPAKE